MTIEGRRRSRAAGSSDGSTGGIEPWRGRLSPVGFGMRRRPLSQIAPFPDAGLEKLYASGRMLLRKLPRR